MTLTSPIWEKVRSLYTLNKWKFYIDHYEIGALLWDEDKGKYNVYFFGRKMCSEKNPEKAKEIVETHWKNFIDKAGKLAWEEEVKDW